MAASKIIPPHVIPPRTVVRLERASEKTPDWKRQVGRVFRVGYYRPKDGLGCIWLVNEDGEYEQTVDLRTLLTHFTVQVLSSETDLFGKRRRKLPSLKPPRARVFRLRHFKRAQPQHDLSTARRTGTA